MTVIFLYSLVEPVMHIGLERDRLRRLRQKA